MVALSSLNKTCLFLINVNASHLLIQVAFLAGRILEFRGQCEFLISVAVWHNTENKEHKPSYPRVLVLIERPMCSTDIPSSKYL